jgi:hypothetical protein
MQHKLCRIEIFTLVTMKSVILRDVVPCNSYRNRRFGGTYRLHHQGGKNQQAKNNVRIMMMEATYYSEMSVLTRDPRRHIPEDGIRSVLQLLVTASVVLSSLILSL